MFDEYIEYLENNGGKNPHLIPILIHQQKPCPFFIILCNLMELALQMSYQHHRDWEGICESPGPNLSADLHNDAVLG